jgi:transposase
MGQKKQRNKYTREFKLDVIQQSYQRDNIRELASELGLRVGLIYKWRASYRQDPQKSFPGQGIESLTPEQREIRRLETENAELRMETNILKKAVGIFSKANG